MVLLTYIDTVVQTENLRITISKPSLFYVAGLQIQLWTNQTNNSGGLSEILIHTLLFCVTLYFEFRTKVHQIQLSLFSHLLFHWTSGLESKPFIIIFDHSFTVREIIMSIQKNMHTLPSYKFNRLFMSPVSLVFHTFYYPSKNIWNKRFSYLLAFFLWVLNWFEESS